MVFGASVEVTAVPRVSQCADTQRIALGRGSSRPSTRQTRVSGLSSSAFIGLPWPKNTIGMRGGWLMPPPRTASCAPSKRGSAAPAKC